MESSSTFLARGRERELAHGHHRRAGLDELLDLRADLREVDAHLAEHVGRDAAALLDQAEQDVLGAQVLVVEPLRLLASEVHHFLGTVCEAIEHGLLVGLGRRAMEGRWAGGGAGRGSRVGAKGGRQTPVKEDVRGKARMVSSVDQFWEAELTSGSERVDAEVPSGRPRGVASNRGTAAEGGRTATRGRAGRPCSSSGALVVLLAYRPAPARP